MRRRNRGLGGITASRVHLAEFYIGRDVGRPLRSEQGRCITGASIKPHEVRGGRIPFRVAEREFMRARREFIHKKDRDDDLAATLLPSLGVFRNKREPSFVGRVIWVPRRGRRKERTAKKFANNMAKMCEQVACRLSQWEVWMRLVRHGKPQTLLRCTPMGVKRPR